MSLTKKVLVALALGYLLGIAASSAGFPLLTGVISILEPVGTLWVNAIRMTVIPLVVASLIAALAGAPDARIVGRVGGLALLIFLALLTLTAIITVAVVPPILGTINVEGWTGPSILERAIGVGNTARPAQTFAQWLIALVPTNPVQAAAEGAMLPLIVFSVAFGMAATRISADSRAVLQQFFATIADAMLKLMQWILELAPIGVFALALPLASRIGAGAAGVAVLYMALVSILCVAVGLLLYPIAWIFGGVSPRLFARGAAEAQAIAASSRSSLASLPPMLDGAEKILGINPAVTRFFLPLSASTFRIGAVIVQVTGVLFLARLYQVDISGATLLTIAFTSILTSFSVPAIAGGSIIVMLPVMLAAGIPAEGLGILIGIDAIPDIFRTVTNITGHMAGVTIVARHTRPEVLPEAPLAPAA